MTTELLRVVVVSREPVPAASILRSEFPAYLPVTVRSVDEVARQLLPESIVLLDLGHGGESDAAARQLRQRGVQQGIVAIGTSADEVTGVIGLEPPIQLDELGAAIERAREHSAGAAAERTEASAGAAQAEPPQPPAPPSSAPSGQPPADPARAAAEPLRSKMERWRRKLTATPSTEAPTEPTQEEMYERLVQVFASAAQVESIATELPIVTDRMALSRAVVMAVGDEFAADTVVLWRRAHNGWVADAHQGLTGREASLPVGFEQPVLQDVEARSGAILLDPTASFQNVLAGIGGARTESFMAAAIALGSRSLGILAVGRDEPLTEANLERLVEMAVEAAVGIGIAQHIERMSNLRRKVDGEAADPIRDPGQWREAFLDELRTAWHERRPDDAPAASDAGARWSVLATPTDEPATHRSPAGRAEVDEPDTVIDLTSKEVRRA